MTVIAWDGTRLVADRAMVNQGHIRSTTKIRKVAGCLYAVTGDASLVDALVYWHSAGADPKTFPTLRNAERWSTLWVINHNKRILAYEDGPWPTIMEDPVFASGSGSDMALGALLAGATAIEAVVIASQRETSCGRGYDVLTLDGPDEPVSHRV